MFAFKPVEEKDCTLLHGWLQQPHITKWWGVTKLNVADFTKKFLANCEQYKYQYFVIKYESQPIGYLQYYDVNKAGEGKWWKDEPEGTWCFDEYIGVSPEMQKVLGAQLVKAIASNLSGNTNVKKIIVCPNPNNTCAINYYEEAGFVKDKLTTTPDGAAIIMKFINSQA